MVPEQTKKRELKGNEIKLKEKKCDVQRSLVTGLAHKIPLSGQTLLILNKLDTAVR